jgi:Cu-Zn family superoxide dismutase
LSNQANKVEDMRLVAGFLLLVSAAFAAGCTHVAGNAPATSAPATSTSTTSGGTRTASGTFVAYTPGATAVTYDPSLVPVGATATVTITQTAASMRVQLTVAGLRPNRGYGAHLHTSPCGPTGEAAGPHYQHQRDPAASASRPSVNPSYANPQNEVWLDFTTDGTGRASAAATHPWTFGTNPRSLIIHAMTTKTAPGEAGTAGARAACLTLPA